MKLEQKNAVVTGAGSGLGLAVAERFAQEGADVAILDLNIGKGTQEAERIAKATGRKVVAYPVDVANKVSVQKAFEAVERDFGAIHIFLNSAGISKIVPFLECSEQLWDQTLDINLKGAFLCCQAAVRSMVNHQVGGSVINMSSQSGRAGTSQYQAYCASKFGIVGLTQSIAQEFARQGIRANTICPGVVFTPLWDQQLGDYARKRNLQPEEVKPYFENSIPAGRLCTVEDVANAAVFLAEDASAYMTGQSLMLCGGAHML